MSWNNVLPFEFYEKPNADLIVRLKERARIRRQIQSRKSVQEGKPDRLADLLEEAAEALTQLERDSDKEHSSQFDSDNASPITLPSEAAQALAAYLKDIYDDSILVNKEPLAQVIQEYWDNLPW